MTPERGIKKILMELGANRKMAGIYASVLIGQALLINSWILNIIIGLAPLGWIVYRDLKNKEAGG